MKYLNVLGSAMLLTIIAYLVADVLTSKRLNMQGLIGRVIIIALLIFTLIRT